MVRRDRVSTAIVPCGGHVVGTATGWSAPRRSGSCVRLHDLRHVAGTMAAATGASTKELMRRLGHASPRAVRYQHASAERDEAIADGIDRILEASRRDGEPDTTVVRFRGAGKRGDLPDGLDRLRRLDQWPRHHAASIARNRPVSATSTPSAAATSQIRARLVDRYSAAS